MDRPSLVQDFQQKMLELLRASPAADVERNVKAFMGQTFTRLDLVTRDEFDVQVELLQALRGRVDALEARLAADPGPASVMPGPPSGPLPGSGPGVE